MVSLQGRNSFSVVLPISSHPQSGCLPCWGKNLFWGLPPPSIVLITPVFPVPLEFLDFHPSGLKYHYYLLTPWQFCRAEDCVLVHA